MSFRGRIDLYSNSSHWSVILSSRLFVPRLSIERFGGGCGGGGSGRYQSGLRLLSFVELLDRQDLLLLLHPSVLEPDLDLTLRQKQTVRQLNPTPTCQIAVEFELLFQFERLEASVGLPASSALVGIRTWKDKRQDNESSGIKSNKVPRG